MQSRLPAVVRNATDTAILGTGRIIIQHPIFLTGPGYGYDTYRTGSTRAVRLSVTLAGSCRWSAVRRHPSSEARRSRLVIGQGSMRRDRSRRRRSPTLMRFLFAVSRTAFASASPRRASARVPTESSNDRRACPSRANESRLTRTGAFESQRSGKDSSTVAVQTPEAVRARPAAANV